MGFIEPTRIGSFQRKNRKATEFRMSDLNCDLSGHPPAKRFLEHGPPQSHVRHRTVSPGRPSPKYHPPQSQGEARQRQNSSVFGTAGETHLESTMEGGHVAASSRSSGATTPAGLGAALASAPVGSAEASERGPGQREVEILDLPAFLPRPRPVGSPIQASPELADLIRERNWTPP